jgi:hypothetical protein
MQNMQMKSMLVALVPALLLAAAAPAHAQDSNDVGAPQPSRDAVMGALNGGGAGLDVLRSYFNGGAPPKDLVGRVDRLISALRDRIGTNDTQTLLAALDRVVQEARASLDAAHVIQLVVDPTFVPTGALVGLDFGPAGAPPAPGFERVTPGDPRLGGELTTQQVSGEGGIQADGISGLKSIKFKVPGDDAGPYRILLATRNLPNPDFRNSFFGQRIEVNGVVSEVRGQLPAEWLGFGMLGEPSGGVLGTAAEGDMLRTGTFGPSQFDEAARQQGGAIMIETYAVNGEIDIQLPSEVPTFLTALIVERADRPSELVLTPEARDAILPLDARLAIEAEIQALAAALLEEIAPAAGPERPSDLPEPVFQSELTASPS